MTEQKNPAPQTPEPDMPEPDMPEAQHDSNFGKMPDLEALADEFLNANPEILEADPRDDEIASLKEEVAATKDRMLRLAADMENLRKRTEREKAEATLYAASNFARDLLSVADSLNRAQASVPDELKLSSDVVVKNFFTGIEMTERELLSVFQRHNIRKIETVGQKFDPNYHQAMFEVPSDEHPPGTVMQEVQSGYAVGERCLRPALVGVSKASE
jgi:molecular chaperone GrpE